MSSVYTVTVSNQDTVEITGGMVGHFYIPYQSYSSDTFIGGSDMTISYVTDHFQVTNGIHVPGNSESLYLYVTSPDEIYMCVARSDSGSSPFSYGLSVFHNR